MKSTYLTEILFSTTVLRLDFTAITVQLTHGGACPSHGNPDETCDLVELFTSSSLYLLNSLNEAVLYSYVHLYTCRFTSLTTHFACYNCLLKFRCINLIL